MDLKSAFLSRLAAVGFLLAAAFPAFGQGLPDFPQVLQPNTILGRTGIGAGPVQALPFATVLAALNGVTTVVIGPGSTTVGHLVTWADTVGIHAVDSGIAVTGTGTLAFGSGNGLILGTSGGTLSIVSGKTLTDTSAAGAVLLLGAAGGGFTSYGGTTCTAGQSVFSLSAVGAATCNAVKAATNKTVGSAAASGSTSAFKMMGLAGTITPVVTGNIQITISGTIIDSGGNTGAGVGIMYQISHGTGGAPTNTAALTGTQDGTVQQFESTATVTAANVFVPFSITVVVTGLTLNTAYWLDLAAENISASNGYSFQNINVAAVEI